MCYAMYPRWQSWTARRRVDVIVISVLFLTIDLLVSARCYIKIFVIPANEGEACRHDFE